VDRLSLSAFLLVSLLACGPLAAPASAQSIEVGADAFEAAFLFVQKEALRAVPSRDLLAGGTAGLADYLRTRGFPTIPVVLTGTDPHDLAALRDAIITAGRRGGSAAAARDAGYAAIDGMLKVVGDPFTRLLVPVGSSGARRESRPAGYSGVGIVLDLEVHPPVVVEIIDDTPAQRAGLRRGDILMEIDGRSTVSMPPQEVVARLRGLPGTSVAMRLRRGGGEFTLTLVREIIALGKTSFRRIGSVGYVKLGSFDEGVGEELLAVVAELQRQGARGLVLDLRGNPGGLIDEAVAVASIFLPRGALTTLVDRNGKRTMIAVTTTGFKFTGPVAVLVDQKTASAAEMVAGALAEAGHAVIGSRSYGKGTVQVLRRLPGGAILQVTVAQYLTPGGAIVEGRGIAPTIEAEPGDAAAGSDEDRVLQAALRWLESRLAALFRMAA
jgi:carboxyl-terminal processing protease